MIESILKLVSIDGVVQPKRCSEKYIQKHDGDIHAHITNHIASRTFKENLKLILTNDDGLCSVCSTPKKMKGNGQFPQTCSPKCSAINRTQGIQPNKVVIPQNELEYLYNVALLQPSIIGELYDTTNVTVMARMDEYGIEKRTHTEQQVLHCNKDVDVWNYNGFDREKANDIDFLITENVTKSVCQIAAEIGCSERKLFSVFEQHSVPVNKKFKISYPEQLIHDFLDEHNITYRHSDRSILDSGLELDIYIPHANVAIEVDGIYWHSELFKSKDYHNKKTDECAAKGIQLLHFWDYEIIDKIDIVKSMILAKIGMIPNKIYARKCVIEEVSFNDAKGFIDNNHLQGMAPSRINKGLFYDGVLVAIGTFMSPRFNRDGYDYELIRYCNKHNTIVVGGISKILNSVNGSVLSYANKRFSNGNVYAQCNFDYMYTTDPGFFYYNNNTGERLSRYKDMRRLVEMRNDGWVRVWDCGHHVYVKSANKKKPIN